MNRELYTSLLEAQVVLSDWKSEYNHDRLHGALDFRTPYEVYGVSVYQAGETEREEFIPRNILVSRCLKIGCKSKVLRRKSVSAIFSAQSLSDVAESSISMSIKDACFTRVYLPDGNALAEDSSSFYKSFGLNHREIEFEIMSQMIPQKEYYYSFLKSRPVYDL